MKTLLTIAGSDSGGGAGIQADIKTALALGVFSTSAITALTAQNTLGVHAIHPVPEAFIREQITCVLQDIDADAIKTGMLHSNAVIDVVAETLRAEAAETPLVVDPVMVAKGGACLLEEAAITALKERLIPLATLTTPNIPEAVILSGQEITSVDDMADAGRALLALGAEAVLVKGGHLPGETVVDVLVTEVGEERFSAPRIASENTHGTGCTLSAAIASFLAQGMALPEAVDGARHYVREAIAAAPNAGNGHGPLNHAVGLQELGRAEKIKAA